MEQEVKIPKHEDLRGNLSFVEYGAGGMSPFEIERVYWIYDIPAGRVRHGRALRRTHELIVAMSGSFTVRLERPDGEVADIFLDRSDRAAFVAAGTWREIVDISTNAVAMVLASGPFDAEEYIYDHAQFKQLGAEGEHAESREEASVDASAEDHAEGHGISSVADCRFIDLPRELHANGSLTAVGNGTGVVPFDVRRVFYLYDVPAGADRGGHSHHEAREVIVALSGSFDVVVDDGQDVRRFTLNRPFRGLYIPRGLWRTLDNFSGGAVALVLTSERFSEADYVRSYNQFVELTRRK